MLIGEYRHNIDPKGRINFPVKLREHLGESFFITRGLDNCLYVYPPSEWQELQQNIKELPRSKRRDLEHFFFSGACEAQPDKQGRVSIPSNLRDYAHLDKDVIVVGASDHAEIWDEQAWNTAFAALSAQTIADTMDELGF